LIIQINELIKLRRPAHRYTPSELQEQIKQQIGDTPANAYGVWVYYPWTRRLVHLLDEAEFTELRTERNHHKLTMQEQQILARKRIGVIGLCVGKATALIMAMERSFREIRLADFDTLDLSNMNRMPSAAHQIGVSKVVLTAREIAEIDPFLRVTCYADGIHEENIDAFLTDSGTLDLILETSDSLDVKFFAREHARELEIPVITYASDRSLLDIERFDLEPNRPLFHGLIGNMQYERFKALSIQERLEFADKMVGAEALPKRLKHMLIEEDGSLYTWPQLASTVVMGGALTADIMRQILLDQHDASGRFPIDLEMLL
jgi:molybdopterin/thiamine biosynthesis adenylyltransferase